MGKRRLRIEFDDADGARFTLAVEGPLTRDKVLRLMEITELLGPNTTLSESEPTGTTFAALRQLIETRFPLGHFTSGEVQEAYEDEYGAAIQRSTVATYLARLTARGYLKRTRLGSAWGYRRLPATTPPHTSAPPHSIGTEKVLPPPPATPAPPHTDA